MTSNGNRRAETGEAAARIARAARMALPLMTPNAREEAEDILSAMDAESAGAAFERDMLPVRDAIVSALEAGDMEAMRGLRALLPHLLGQANRRPALADELARQIGRAMLEGMAG